MKSKLFPLLFVLPVTGASAALISLNDITPGTESITLVGNGGFEDGTGKTTPDGWIRGNSMFYDTDANAGLTSAGFSNIPSTGKVAYYSAPVTGNNVNGSYRTSVSGLEANTQYVFSAYLWNNSGNKNLVMDFNDNKPEGTTIAEPQMILGGNVTDAADGYFMYATFDTGATGTEFDVRIFTQPGPYDTAGTYFAWDNVALTKSSEFVAPTLVPEPSMTLLGGLGLLGLLARRRRN